MLGSPSGAAKRSHWSQQRPSDAILRSCRIPEPATVGELLAMEMRAGLPVLLGLPWDPAQGCSIYATVNERTDLIDRRNGSHERIEVENFVVGDRLSVDVESIILTYRPAQGLASTLVRLNVSQGAGSYERRWICLVVRAISLLLGGSDRGCAKRCREMEGACSTPPKTSDAACRQCPLEGDTPPSFSARLATISMRTGLASTGTA